MKLSYRIIIAKTFIHVALISHLLSLVYGLLNRGLGVNLIETLTHVTGEWGLRLLLITLAITPIRRLLHWNSLLRFRRLLGLWSFVYISLHFLIFLVFDHYFDWLAIFEDIIDRPYISVGFAAFLLMIPLTITSVSALQRKMGRSWMRLHQLVYVVAVLAVVHFLWLVKSDLLEPLVYGAVLFVLLSVRLFFFGRKKWSRYKPARNKATIKSVAP